MKEFLMMIFRETDQEFAVFLGNLGSGEFGFESGFVRV